MKTLGMVLAMWLALPLIAIGLLGIFMVVAFIFSVVQWVFL